MTDFFEDALEKRKHLGLLRQMKVVNDLIDFSSNDYLGLASSFDLKNDLLCEWERLSHLTQLTGLGSTGSRLLTGHKLYYEELEKELACFHGFEGSSSL